MKPKHRISIFELAGEQGLLPPFHHSNEKRAKKILDSIYKGGLRIIEYTNRSSHALEIFEGLAKHAEKNLPGLILGSGTIMNAKQAKQFYRAGSQFIVAPIVVKEVGEFCNKNDLFWCPGAFSPTEIVQAHDWGADLVKIFPADIATPAFVKALRGPCPWVHVMPSGGVTMDKENIRQWLESGVHCIAIGSQLFNREILEEEKYDLLEQRIRWLLDSISEIRSS